MGETVTLAWCSLMTMTSRWAWRSGLVLVLLVSHGCGDDAESSDIRDAASLTSALGAANAGDTVRLGEVTIDGTFVIPAGVHLAGAGPGTVLRASGGGALIVQGGADGTPTTVSDLRIDVPASAGAVAAITAHGTGAVELTDLAVNCDIGVGIVAQVDTLSVTRVSVDGALTDAMADSLSAQLVDPAVYPVAGIVIEGGVARMEQVSVSDFAGFGVVLSSTEASWTDGDVSGVLGTGALIEAADVELIDVVVREGRASSLLGSFSLPYGVVAARDSRVTTSGLQILANPGIGVLQDASRSEHLDLRVVGNGDAGLWVQREPSSTAAQPALLVSGGLVQSNGRVGVGAFDVGGVVLDQTLIVDTRALPGVSGETGAITISDGLQVRQTDAQTQQLVINDTLIYGQGRAALLADDGVVGTTDAAATVTLCGPGQIDRARWTCEPADDGSVTCSRALGPSVAGPWTCEDSGDGARCVSTDAAVVADPESAPALTPPPADAGVVDAEGRLLLGRPDDPGCAAQLDAFVERTGVVAGAGRLVAGAVSPLAVVGENGVIFSCRVESGTRVCDASLTDRPGRSLDNPTWDDGPGWTCSFEAAGRVCAWGGAGVAQRGTADLAGLLEGVSRLGLLDVRDAALLESGAFDAPQFLAESPLSVGVVGENGVMGDAGAVGARGVVGENGVIFRAVVGENGFQ